MTEGFEHLLQTYQIAGFKIQKPGPRAVAWGFSVGQGHASPTERVTVVYAILGGPDDMGRVLAQRWGYETMAGERVEAPGLMATPMRADRFDATSGGDQW